MRRAAARASGAGCGSRCGPLGGGGLGCAAEALGWLVPLPVFKTGVARYPGQASSIPVRLRSSARNGSTLSAAAHQRETARLPSAAAQQRERLVRRSLLLGSGNGSFSVRFCLAAGTAFSVRFCMAARTARSAFASAWQRERFDSVRLGSPARDGSVAVWLCSPARSGSTAQRRRRRVIAK